jgi:thiol-disulfide isomerase/thioredoxin
VPRCRTSLSRTWLPALTLLLATGVFGCRSGTPPSLPIGAAAPEFSLPGADGKTHSLGDFAGSSVLAVIFTCNTCPASQLYERRIQQLHDDYRGKGVAVVAINPNRPDALRLADLSHTDVGDALEDMKARASPRGLC